MEIVEVIDVTVLAYVLSASFVLAKFWGILTDRLPFWNKMSDLGRELGGYAIIIVSGVLMWFTKLNALPGFYATGRALTCIIAALGPSAMYDCFYDKPEPPSV